MAPARWPTRPPETRRIVDHRHARALRLARIEAAHHELAGVAADLGGRHQVLEMDGAGPFVVALHAGAFAAQHRAGQREAAAAVAAGETVAGGQHHRSAAPAGLGALGIGDALHGARSVLGLGGHGEQLLRGRTCPVVEIEVGPRAGQQFFRREAANRVFRHGARHVDGAAGQFPQRGGVEVGRGDEGLALAHEDAQPEIAALAALQLLALAQPLRHRDRLAVDVERVGRVGAVGLRPLQQVAQEIGVDGASGVRVARDLRGGFDGRLRHGLARGRPGPASAAGVLAVFGATFFDATFFTTFLVAAASPAFSERTWGRSFSLWPWGRSTR